MVEEEKIKMADAYEAKLRDCDTLQMVLDGYRKLEEANQSKEKLANHSKQKYRQIDAKYESEKLLVKSLKEEKTKMADMYEAKAKECERLIDEKKKAMELVEKLKEIYRILYAEHEKERLICSRAVESFYELQNTYDAKRKEYENLQTKFGQIIDEHKKALEEVNQTNEKYCEQKLITGKWPKHVIYHVILFTLGNSEVRPSYRKLSLFIIKKVFFFNFFSLLILFIR